MRQRSRGTEARMEVGGVSDNEAKIHLYEVAASEWRTRSGGGGWRVNFSINLITTSVGRALALFEEAHPDAEVHRIEKRDRTERLQVDPVLAVGPVTS